MIVSLARVLLAKDFDLASGMALTGVFWIVL